MTIDQEIHLERMKNKFRALADKKYRKGQNEHGGNLFDKPTLELLKEIQAESIDLFIYTQTAIDRMERHG